MPGSIEKEKEKKNNSISKLDIRWFHFKKKKKNDDDNKNY